MLLFFRFESNSFDTSSAHPINSTMNTTLQTSSSHNTTQDSLNTTPERMYISSVESRTKVYNTPQPLYTSTPGSKFTSSSIQHVNNVASASEFLNGTVSEQSSHSLEQRMLKQSFTTTTTSTSRSYRVNES